MTKILFYNHTRQVSGGERVLLNMLAVVQEAAFEVSVACPAEGKGNLDELLRAAGVRVVPVPVLLARFTSNPVKLVQYLGSVIRAVRGFRRMVRSEQPDLLHANSVRAGIVATAATVGMPVPVLWHVQDDLPAHPISVAIRCFAWLSQRTQFVAVSKATAKTFCGRIPFGERSHVLYNAIDASRFPAKTVPLDGAARAFREELGLTPEDFLAVAVGMINPRKGVLELVEGFENVQWNLQEHGRPRAHLAIVGAAIFNDDHLYEAKVQERAKALGLSDTVHFTGPRKDVPAVLRAANVLVHNASVEPFGLVVLEAMASGTPVIAAAVGGIPEIVQDGVNGELVPSPASGRAKDDEVLPGRIYFAAASPGSLDGLAERALEETVPRFGLERFGEGLLRIYGMVMGREK
jgi:glycosyltransferase involved in cell wall biosynthesis